MKTAILHPCFVSLGGGEQTAGVISEAFPDADWFSLLCDREGLPSQLLAKTVRSLPINWLPAKYRYFRHLLPFWPVAVESIDLRGYDLVITSDSSVMKGALVDQSATHICYCHSPMRCLWDLHKQYYESMPRLIRPFFAVGTSYVRQWDFHAAQRIDYFIANSRYIAQRIRQYYRRNSVVIYPPVNTANGYITRSPSDYYLSVSRLTEMKRIDLLIGACNKLNRRLMIVGAGREERRLKSLAGPSIDFVGRISDAELHAAYANCRAFLFAADEDFGIAPVEAQAFGRPVIAYGRGGSLETVRVADLAGRSDTGVFFEEQTVASVINGILSFESLESNFIPTEIQRHAREFDTQVFIDKLLQFVRLVMPKEL
jgi:glycosyltransferase involved in cell wall biosynthesis